MLQLIILLATLSGPAAAFTCNTYIGSDNVEGGVGHEDCLPGIEKCVQRSWIGFLKDQEYGMSCDDFPYVCKGLPENACCMLEGDVPLLGTVGMIVKCFDSNPGDVKVHRNDFDAKCYCKCSDPSDCSGFINIPGGGVPSTAAALGSGVATVATLATTATAMRQLL